MAQQLLTPAAVTLTGRGVRRALLEQLDAAGGLRLCVRGLRGRHRAGAGDALGLHTGGGRCRHAGGAGRASCCCSRADPDGARDELLHTMACKSAIKAGMITDTAELPALVRQGAEPGTSGTAPTAGPWR